MNRLKRQRHFGWDGPLREGLTFHAVHWVGPSRSSRTSPRQMIMRFLVTTDKEFGKIEKRFQKVWRLEHAFLPWTTQGNSRWNKFTTENSKKTQGCTRDQSRSEKEQVVFSWLRLELFFKRNSSILMSPWILRTNYYMPMMTENFWVWPRLGLWFKYAFWGTHLIRITMS